MKNVIGAAIGAVGGYVLSNILPVVKGDGWWLIQAIFVLGFMLIGYILPGGPSKPKLSKAAAAILAQLQTGPKTQAELAMRFGVSEAVIQQTVDKLGSRVVTKAGHSSKTYELNEKAQKKGR